MGTVGLLETKSFRILRERLEEAVEGGVNAIVYGPPSSEKSFVLENLCEQFRAAKKPVVYVYCGPRCTEGHLYRSLAEAAGVAVRSSLRWACRYALLKYLWSREKLPALIFDEAQHLDLDAYEGIRQLHDLTRRDGRPGCGIILAGSHSLLRDFLHPQRRLRMEQLLSRFPFRVQLTGMSQREILALGARAFGNGKAATLSEKHQKALLDACVVQDPFFIGDDGKAAPRTYYSSRRLLEFIRQQRKSLKFAEGVA